MAPVTRNRVQGVIFANPGLSVRSIARKLDLDESTAGYHLRKLYLADKAAPEVRGRETLWYPAGHGLCPVLRRTIPLVRDKIARDVAHAFGDSPLTCHAIDRRTGHSERRVRTALGQLESAGLVDRTSRGRVFLTDGARTCLEMAADKTPCALWGTCPVSARWTKLGLGDAGDGVKANRSNL